MHVGERIVVERAYSVADVAAFAELTGDRGLWHMVPDATGRLVVHGLATVALTTRCGVRHHAQAGDMRGRAALDAP